MKTKILHIDDDKFLLDMYKTKFEKDGNYEVISLLKLDLDFLTQIANISPDIILSDLTKPSPNGMEILRALRSDTRTSKIPFVFLSNTFGPHLSNEFSEANKLGIQGYIVKANETPDGVAERVTEVIIKTQFLYNKNCN